MKSFNTLAYDGMGKPVFVCVCELFLWSCSCVCAKNSSAVWIKCAYYYSIWKRTPEHGVTALLNDSISERNSLFVGESVIA